ncbi:MAG: aldose epimerase [Verrucomicrobiota bacterium]
MHAHIDQDGESLHRWVKGVSTFWAHPEKGARLMRWDVEMADGSLREVLCWPEKPDWDTVAKIRGGNPILFPFAARTFHKGELGKWKAPSGTILPMAMHGYARQGEFELESAASDGFIARFIPSEEAKEAYPFEYNFYVHYRFFELALEVSLTLENTGNEPIPWSAGHHFYFNLPWHSSLERKHYRIELPKAKAFRQDPGGKLLAEKTFPQTDTFANPDLSDRIHTKLKKPEATFGPAGGEEDIKISWTDSEGNNPWHTLVTWTMDDDAPYYCIEPWMGPPNSPETNKGLHWVKPRESQNYKVRLELV